MIPFISIRFGCVHDKRKTKRSENEGRAQKSILFCTRRWWFRAQAALVANSFHTHTFPPSFWFKTIYPEYNTHRVWVCHQYNIFNLLKRSRFWFSLAEVFLHLPFFWVWSNLCLFMTYGREKENKREWRRQGDGEKYGKFTIKFISWNCLCHFKNDFYGKKVF